VLTGDNKVTTSIILTVLATHYFWFRLQLQFYTHTSASIGVFMHNWVYENDVSVHLEQNERTCHSTKFCKQSKCSKWFHSDTKVEKHWQSRM